MGIFHMTFLLNEHKPDVAIYTLTSFPLSIGLMTFFIAEFDAREKSIYFNKKKVIRN